MNEELQRERKADAPVRVISPSLDQPSLRDRAVSAALWASGVSVLVPVLGPLAVLSALVPSDRIDRLNRLYCKLQLQSLFTNWRAIVHPDVDRDRAYVFAQNHVNHLDHVVLYNATPHFKQGLELESHFKYPFYGWFMKARGTIPVRPGAQGQTPEILDRMRREIAAGHSILTFPEGTRTTDGRVGNFRKGTFFIARDLGVPIVPVAVTGAFDLMRKGSLVLRPGARITVWVEKPIETAGLTDEQIPALAERVRSVIAARVDAFWRARARGER